MPELAIVTDSVASIPEKMLDALKISWVPYYIHHSGESFRDLVNIHCDKFFELLPTLEKLPKTANPSAKDYLDKYLALAQEGFSSIASIHISSVNSGAYQAAVMAKNMLSEKLPEIKVEVIDTLNVAMGQGWMVIEAARAALEGAQLPDIKAIIEKMVPITKMMQTADTLRYLYMGGRIGKAKQMAASVLDIKPIIGVENGELVPLGQARTRKKVYQQMVDKLDKAVGQQGIKIAFMHAAAREEAEKLKAMVEQRVEVIESIISELSPALGVHTGPGTVGFSYFPVTS